MMSASTAFRPVPADMARQLADRLFDLVEEILAGLDEVRELLREDVPRMERLATLRSHLGLLRLEHARTLGEILAFMQGRNLADSTLISERRTAYQQLLSTAVRHGSRWSSKDVAADWDGYRTESARLIRDWRHSAKTERDLLIPILIPQAA